MFDAKLACIILTALLTTSQSFFFFNQKKSGGEEVVYSDGPVSRIRGVPASLEDRYTSSSALFQCLNGEKVINQSSVNDEYCDCPDGSDEPGTSACSHVQGNFYCINKGYKTIKISRSRIDDGLCDCCDGSDEGRLTRCPNTCLKLGEQEKDELERIKITYLAGSKVLADAEAKIKNELQAKVNEEPARKKEVDVLTAKLASLRSQEEHQKSQLNELYDNLKSTALSEVKGLLSLDSLPVPELSKLLSSVFELMNFSEQAVTNMLSGNDHDIDAEHAAISHSDHLDENSHHDHYGHDDPYHDHELGVGDDHDINDESASSHDDASAIVDVQDTAPEALASAGGEGIVDNSDIASCEFFVLSSDSRMRSLCQQSDNMIQSAKDLLSEHIFRSKRPFREYQLLVGYYSLHQTYEHSATFVKDILANTESNVCPALFSANPDVCQLEEKLASLHGLLDRSVDSLDKEQLTPMEKYYFETKDSCEAAQNQLSTAEEALKESQDAQAELQNPSLSYLAYKGEKISVQDGRYSYNVYIMDRTTQAEGHEVTLGRYSSSDDKENGDLVWKFTDGDYCWNFGPRTADVQVSCGRENKLLSAREPSTCYYLLTMESPLACSKKYAEVNGLEF
jgi:protein kinase C substrate 80K-H